MWRARLTVDTSEQSQLPGAQQRAWQSRWSKSATEPSVSSVVAAAHPPPSPPASAPPPPSPPAAGQAPEARRAIETALKKLIPQPGDGRRGGYDNQVNVKRESDTVRRLLQQDGLSEWRPDPAQLPAQQPAPTQGRACATAQPGEARLLHELVRWVVVMKFNSKIKYNKPTSSLARLTPCTGAGSVSAV